MLYPPLAFFSRAYTGWDGTLLIHGLATSQYDVSPTVPSSPVAQWLNGKESACNARATGNPGSIPEEAPWRR